MDAHTPLYSLGVTFQILVNTTQVHEDMKYIHEIMLYIGLLLLAESLSH